MAGTTIGGFDVGGAWAKAPDAITLEGGQTYVAQNRGGAPILIELTASAAGPTGDGDDNLFLAVGRAWILQPEDGDALWTRTVAPGDKSRLVIARART